MGGSCIVTNHGNETKADDRFHEGISIATWRWGVPACECALAILDNGGSALDAVEAGVMSAEDDPGVHTVGFGAWPDALAEVTLDALIIDGPTRRMGAVAVIPRIQNAIAVARRIMEKSPHIILAGEGALRFALEEGFEEKNLLCSETFEGYEKWRRDRENAGPPPGDQDHDTITHLAQDRNGDLAGACSTGGSAWKWPGRVGDSPIPGAGLYVDNEIGAGGATGFGEIAVRNCATFDLVERMRSGRSPQEACEETIERLAANLIESEREKQLAVIAIDTHGSHGAHSLRPGFVYGLARDGKVEKREAASHFAEKA